MKLKFKLKRLKEKLTTKETNQDKILQKNIEPNREIKIETETNYHFDCNAFLVYINNYGDIVNLYTGYEQRADVEKNISDIKILIESTFNKHFLDSLNFFLQINRCVSLTHFIQTKFVETSFLFSPSGNEDKIYVLISGSFGDYIDLIDHFHYYYSDKRNRIISSIINILNNETPIMYSEKLYGDLNKKYNLNMRGIDYRGCKIVNEPIINLKEIDISDISKPTLMDISLLSKSALLPKLDKEIQKIVMEFHKQQLETGEINILYYFGRKGTTIQDIISPFKKSIFELSYLIDHEDIEYLKQLDHFYQEAHDAKKIILEMVQDIINTNFQTITYHNTEEENQDQSDQSQQLSMYDLIDEIIR